MKRRHTVLLSVLAIVVALGIVAVLVPLSAFRGPLEAAASSALGRRVQIAGPLHLAVFPQFGISLKNVSIANTAGAPEPQMITVGKIVVGARLAPLLTGHLDVTKLVLKEPVIHLEVAGNGVGNWQATQGPGAARLRQSPAEPVNLDLESIRIEGGQITYSDARSGKSETLSGVGLTLTIPSSAAGGRSLSLAGSATYNAVPVKFDAKLDSLDGLTGGGASNAQVALSSDLFDADFTGSVEAPASVSGNLKLTAGSVRRLAAWAGMPLPPGNGFGAVAVTAGLVARGGVYSLSKTAITLDGMNLKGDLSIDTQQGVPALKGTLAVDHIDVRPYLAPGASADVASAAKPVNRNAPLALGGLKAVDAGLSLTIGGLILPDFRIDRAVASVVLHGGVLQARLASIAAYGGTGSGSLAVDASGPVPSFRSALDMSGISMRSFLGQVMGITRISAPGSVRLNLVSRGQTEAGIVASLGGTGSIALGRGSVGGVDLAAVARVLKSAGAGQFLPNATGGSSNTEFDSVRGTFTIRNGVLQTTDLQMLGPVVDMTGTGMVNLVTHQIEFHLDPKAGQNVPGLNLVDIGIPFYVKGDWNAPTYGPDPQNLVKGIINGIGGTATRLPGKILQAPVDALKSLFGGH